MTRLEATRGARWALALAGVVLGLGGAVPASAQERTLTLDDAVQMALSASPAIRASGAYIDAAREGEGIALTGYMPSLNATVSYSRATANSARASGLPGATVADPTNSSSNYFNFGLALQQPIWDFGRTMGANDVAKAGTDVAVANLATSRLTAWYNVVVSYYAVLAAQELIGVAQRALDQALRYADQSKAMFEAGTKPRLDVVTTEANAQNARVALLSAQDTLRITKVQLLSVMGSRERYDFAVVKPADPPEQEGAQTTEQAFNVALDARPERKSLLAQIEAQEAQVRTVWSNYLPSLAASASFTDAGVEFTEWKYWNWNVGVTLSIPLLSALSTVHQVGQARANVLATRANLDATEIAIRNDVEQAAVQLRDARAKLGPLQAALDASREAQMLAEGRYHEGAGNQVELLDAQAAFANAEAALVRARFDVGTAWAAWTRAVGRGPEVAP